MDRSPTHLLFQGRYSEALVIYRQYWDKPLHEKTFGEVTLEEFAAFDKRARMKRALGDLSSRQSNQVRAL